MILVDTSVWVDHLRESDDHLAELLHTGDAACHPFVIGELACGNLGNRRTILTLLSALPKVSDAEAIDFIEHHRLMGKGLGWVDVHLIASCALAGVTLWTRDKRLTEAASQLKCAYDAG